MQQIRQQMREHYGAETWREILSAMRQALRGAAFYRRIDMITSRINSGGISVNQNLKDSVAALKTEVDSY